MTMTLVSTVTVGAGGASSIAFNSIPNTATDILIQYSIRHSAGDVRTILPISFNSTTTTYAYRDLYGTGTATGSGSGTRFTILVNADGADPNVFGNGSIYIPNYASSQSKSYSVDAITETNGTGTLVQIVAGSWNGTSAISSITIGGDTGTIMQYSTASLYTITKGSGGATVS